MANVCFFDMKAKGEQSNVYKFLYMLQSEMTVTKESLKNGEYNVRVFGQCRWSVLRGLIERANLPALSEKLSVETEIFGIDPGYPESVEHYYYKNGQGIIERPSEFDDYDLEEIKELVPEINLEEYETADDNGESYYKLKSGIEKDCRLDIDKEKINAQFTMP